MAYKQNRRFDEQWYRASATHSFLQRQADGVAEAARRIAREEAYETGAYYESLQGKVVVRNGVPTAIAFSDVPYAPVIEIGGAHNRPIATLRRAGEGYRVH